MNNKQANDKSRNENAKDNFKQQTAEPITLYEIKSISKDIIGIIKTEMDSIGILSILKNLDSNKMLQNLVQLLHSIHEDIKKKFANTTYLPKIEEIFDKNLELILNYFIRCFQHTDTVKISITNNIINGLSNIQNVATILTDQFLSQEKFNEKQISSNFIFDEEFVTLINSLSCAIKEFMKNCNSCLKVINSSMDSLVDQLITSKTTISDLQLQYNNSIMQNNQMKYSQKQGGMQPTTKDKLFKDKLSSLIDKVEILSALRVNLSKNLKFVDNYCSRFYDDSKIIFKKLKTLHNEKLNEIQNCNSMLNQNANDLIAKVNTVPLNSANINHNINNNNYNNNYNNSSMNNNRNFQNNSNPNAYNEAIDDNDNNNNNLYQFSNNNNNENNLVDENYNNLNQEDVENNNNNSNINNNYNEMLNNCQGDNSPHNIRSSNVSNKTKSKIKNFINKNNMNLYSVGNYNNRFIDTVSPVNRRENSSNFISYNNANINNNNNNINKNKDSRSSSNPKFSKSKILNKNSNLNNSMGKMAGSGSGMGSNNFPHSNPSNLLNSSNNISTNKIKILNKSASNLKFKKSKSKNSLSLSNYISNQSNKANTNTFTENEFRVIQKNEELNNRIKDLLEEINSLNDSYKKLAEENLCLKKLNNPVNFSGKSKNSKNLNKHKTNYNLEGNAEDPNHGSYYNSNNICSNCKCLINEENNYSFKYDNSNDKTRKQSSDMNNLIINSEANEQYYSNNINNTNINNNNNLNISANSFMNNNNNNNLNASNSEKFHNFNNMKNGNKTNKEALLELNNLSEKIIYFLELMQKLQEEISKKSNVVRELKIKFEETKIDLLNQANNACYNARLEVERDYSSSKNYAETSPNHFSNNSKLKNNSSTSIPNMNNSKTKFYFSKNSAPINNININLKNSNVLTTSIGSKNALTCSGYNNSSMNNNNSINNKRSYNTTILNYASKKIDSNSMINNLTTNNNNENTSYNNINMENQNVLSTVENINNNIKNSHMNNSSNSNNYYNNNNVGSEYLNSKKKSFTNQQLLSNSADTRPNFSNNINTSNINNQEITQENSNNNNIENLNNNNDYNLKQGYKLEECYIQANNNNNFDDEYIHNILKELEEFRNTNKNLLNDLESKGNIIEELNDKLFTINQKLVDASNDFNEEHSKNIAKLQENEQKINELMNELNLMKLTNQALYAEINRNHHGNNNDNNENYDENEQENEQENDHEQANQDNDNFNDIQGKEDKANEQLHNKKKIN